MSGDWYFDILKKMDPDKLDAIVELLFLPKNDEVRLRLSKYCDTREEMAIVAKNIFGFSYK
jgi:hypothetical protein